MRLGRVALLVGTASLLVADSSVEGRAHAKRRSKTGPSLYELKGLVDISGETVDMSAFEGRVSLVVNVASA